MAKSTKSTEFDYLRDPKHLRKLAKARRRAMQNGVRMGRPSSLSEGDVAKVVSLAGSRQWTMEAIATKFGVSRSTVSRIVSGKLIS